MTRKQVAQRLGKSLATVRRMEGVLLHPTQDSRGVNHFDSLEVESVARGITGGRIVIHRELSNAALEQPSTSEDADEGCENCAKLERRLEDLRTSHEREIALLRAQYDSEARNLVAQVESLLAVLAE